MKSKTLRPNYGDIILFVISSLSSLITPILLAYLIDNIIFKGNYKYIYYWIIGSLLIIIISSILSFYFVQFIILKRSVLNSEILSNKLIYKLLKMPIKLYEKNANGYYFNVLTNSTFNYADLYSQYCLELMASIIVILVILVITFLFNIYLWILFIIFIPIVVFSSKSQSNKLANLQKDAMYKQDISLNDLRNIIDRKREINILKEDKFFLDKFKNSMGKWTKFVLKYKFYNCLVENLPKIVTNIYNVILLGIGAILISNNKLTTGVLVMGYQFLGYLSSPVINCTQILIRLKANKEHLDRVDALENSNNENDYFSHLKIESQFLFKCETFSLYKNGLAKELLFTCKDIAIRNKGLYIIKGENGCGKSSILNYILGYSDVDLGKGDFYISNRIDNSAFLTYPIILVNGSFKENIFNRNYDPKLLDILNINFEYKIINSNPVNLSLGEQQKIGLLRTLSMDFEYLFLDEPLSNLDKSTQDNIVNYLEKLKKEKTIVAIMHDNSFDSISDKIYTIYEKVFS